MERVGWKKSQVRLCRSYCRKIANGDYIKLEDHRWVKLILPEDCFVFFVFFLSDLH